MAAGAYDSADQAAVRIEKRLRRYKRRRKDHQGLRAGRKDCKNAITIGRPYPARH